MKLHIFKSVRLISLVFATLHASAQDTYTGQPPAPVAGEAALPNDQIKARYQNCELGHYQGAQPGKVRYAKDRYIWAVTPEFAKRFCMPQVFVSEELKGAEAVAFKLVPGGFGENCGFGGKAEVCSQGMDLRFEIYISRDVKLPVKNEVEFTAPRYRNDSIGLLGRSKTVEEHQALRHKTTPIPGLIPRYETNAFGLAGIQGNKVVWPITTLYLDEYRGKLYDGSIDYIAVQGQTGNFRNRRMLKERIQDFVMLVQQVGHKGRWEDTPFQNFAHLIHLPRAFSAQVQAMDNARGDDWEALGKKALMPAEANK
ncbi:hypothetical protein [Limnohabitans sp.]|uniref:hypothetical protein n=1 Tax=Limnohabitans sp. TaxID=1907725 RepID=UPI00286EB61D|nr:hypothetical protein [Limnohabitans sp.]